MNMQEFKVLSKLNKRKLMDPYGVSFFPILYDGGQFEVFENKPHNPPKLDALKMEDNVAK